MYEFRLRFHWNSFLGFKSTTFQYWSRFMAWRRPGDKPLSGPMMVSYWRIYASLGLHELKPFMWEALMAGHPQPSCNCSGVFFWLRNVQFPHEHSMPSCHGSEKQNRDTYPLSVEVKPWTVTKSFIMWPLRIISIESSRAGVLSRILSVYSNSWSHRHRRTDLYSVASMFGVTDSYLVKAGIWFSCFGSSSSSSNCIDTGGQNWPMSHTKQHKIPQDKIEWLKHRKITR